MKNYNIRINYSCNNKKYNIDNAKSEHFDLEIDDNDGIKIILKPKIEITDFELYVILPLDLNENSRFYTNGFQSWSYSTEYKKSEIMNQTAPILKPAVYSSGGRYIGDSQILNQKKEKGVFHSFSHCYLREINSNNIDLFGSFSDDDGYTIFICDMNNSTLTITKDLHGVKINTTTLIMNIIELNGEYDEVFDKYFDIIKIKPLPAPTLKGYTSWYNYKQNINEDIILKDLESLKIYGDKLNIFQIDDGYQTAVGDPLVIDNKKFPKGMKFIADKIHENNLMAGLWLCPFGAEPKSKVFKEHPDWLVKDANGVPIKVGVAWGGFYALDILLPEVKAYVKEVFNTIVDEWGFDLLKLDFLYCVAVVPRQNKSRGEIMAEAIDFIKECIPDKLILGCGVPLMPVFGKFHYCRIGCDVNYSWKMPLDYQISREMISTRKSINNTIFRRYLNNRAFLNDPDVFILREINCNLSKTEKSIMAEIAKIFTNVQLVSDTAGRYPDTIKEQYLKLIQNDVYKIVSVNKIMGSVIRIDYMENDIPKLLVFDLKTAEIHRKQ